MVKSLKQFFKDLITPFSDRQTAVVLLAATVLLLSFRYFRFRFIAEPYGILNKTLVVFLLFFVIPLAFVTIMRKHPKVFGLVLGNWRVWLVDVAVLYGLLLPLLIFASQRPEFRSFYPLFRLAKLGAGFFLLNGVIQLVDMVSWEFFFRGFMLFGLGERVGLPAAILIQTLPYAVLHFGKPPLEAFGSVIAGILLGVIAYRGKSIFPCVLLHFFAAITLDLLIVVT